MDNILDVPAHFYENEPKPFKFMTRLYPKRKAFGCYRTHHLKLDHWQAASPELQVNLKRVDFFIANPINRNLKYALLCWVFADPVTYYTHRLQQETSAFMLLK